MNQLRLILALLLTVCASGLAAQQLASQDDRAIVQAVLESHALPELVQNWHVSAASAEVIVNDHLAGCALPHAAAATGDKHVVPQSLVRQCQSQQDGVLLDPPLQITKPIKVSLEESDVIMAEFRKPDDRWNQRHPNAVGAIFLGRPVYARDLSLAAVSYSRFRNGIGGGVFFCLLRRDSSGKWNVEWQETVTIE